MLRISRVYFDLLPPLRASLTPITYLELRSWDVSPCKSHSIHWTYSYGKEVIGLVKQGLNESPRSDELDDFPSQESALPPLAAKSRMWIKVKMKLAEGVVYFEGLWSHRASWNPAVTRVFCHSFKDLTGKPHMKTFFLLVNRRVVLADTKPERERKGTNYIFAKATVLCKLKIL